MVQRKCPKCGAIFDRKSTYDYHINKVFDSSTKKSNQEKLSDKKICNNTYFNDLQEYIRICQNMPFCAETVPKYAENSTKINLEIKNEESLEENLEIDKVSIYQDLCCHYCKKNFSSKSTLTRHLKSNCKVKKENDEVKKVNDIEKEKIFKLLFEKDSQYKKELKYHKEEMEELKKQNKILINKIENITPKNNEIIKIHKTIKKLETNIPANTNLTISNQFIEKLIQKDKEIEELTIKHVPKKVNESLYNDNEFDKLLAEIENNNIIITNNVNNEMINTINEAAEINEPITLILNNDVVECRKKDGYVNATQLCKAGGKKISHWINLESTKKIISVLASNAGIPALNLIEKNVGGNHSSTWIHPDLAIQLAQWLSPEFALQVSSWIRTLFVDGKVEVNIKLLKEQENIIKTCKKRIKHLENRILKKQPRQKYDNSKFVVYLATNKHKKKDRTYTVGLAKDLSERISNYDKLEDHFPIYYKAFMDEEQMKVAEDMVLKKLYVYREKESKDRFILPVGKDIKLFTKAIDDAVNFFNS
jgi:uncharacterized C2H2 Zn-finger protein